MTRKRAWRKSLHRTETWKGKRVKVTRSNRGRFVSWHKIRRYRRGVTAKRAWRTGVSRRGARFGGGKGVAVWSGSKRIQMHGSGQQLYRAMQLAVKHPPKEKFLTISAEALLDDPYNYLERREWHDRPSIKS